MNINEKLNELARLQSAAMAEQTTIAICAYRRALLREGAALLEYVRQLEAERDQLRAELIKVLRFVGGQAVPDVSTPFLLNVSEEVSAVLAGMTQVTADLRSEVERLRGEVSGVRKVLRSRHCPPLNGETVAEAFNTAFFNAESHMDGLRKQRDNATARAEAAERERDEASQLLRELAEILNPHDHYDQAKLLGWARDTVERAREADVAQAHAQDLSRAMEAQPYTSFSFRADGELLCLTKECVRHFPAGSTVANVGHTTDCPEGMKQAALSRTPAQSLARLKAGVLRDEYRKLAKRFREADHRGRPAIVSVTWAVLAESMDLEADRLEATDGL